LTRSSIGPDGWTHAETLSAVSKRVHELAEEQHLCFLNTIMSQLSAEEIHLVRPEEMSGEQERFLEEYFHRTLYPIVTPLAIDPGHPFPYLANRSLCLVVSLGTRIASRLPHTDLSIVLPDASGAAIYSAAKPRGPGRLHAVGGRLAPLFVAALSRL
jgi:polyphosphate kinase